MFSKWLEPPQVETCLYGQQLPGVWYGKFEGASFKIDSIPTIARNYEEVEYVDIYSLGLRASLTQGGCLRDRDVYIYTLR